MFLSASPKGVIASLAIEDSIIWTAPGWNRRAEIETFARCTPSSLVKSFSPEIASSLLRLCERVSLRRFSRLDPIADGLHSWCAWGSIAQVRRALYALVVEGCRDVMARFTLHAIDGRRRVRTSISRWKEHSGTIRIPRLPGSLVPFLISELVFDPTREVRIVSGGHPLVPALWCWTMGCSGLHLEGALGPKKVSLC